MSSSGLRHLTDKEQTAFENIRRLSVRIMQLESLVSIQNEIINYLLNTEHLDKNHPLLNVSKRLQESLISAPIKGNLAFGDENHQNTLKIDEVGAERRKATKQLHFSNPVAPNKLEDNGNNGDEILRHCKSPAAKAAFQRDSNTWKNPVEAPFLSINGQAGNSLVDEKLILKRRYATHFSLLPEITPISAIETSQRLENERGDRIISSRLTDSDSASLVSSELEIEVFTPHKQTTEDDSCQPSMKGEFSRMTENPKKTTLMDPIFKNLPFSEWVSNQRNNNKRLERSGVLAERAVRQSHSNMKARNDNNDHNFTDFINACHLLHQSLENPKSVSPSKMVTAMPIMRDYWFHNTTSYNVTVESLEALLSVVSQFPTSVAGRIVNQKDREGRTFLHIAVCKRLWRLVEIALEECREFDLNQTDACGRTPLILMAFYASQPMGMEEHAALDSLVRRSAESTRTAALLAAVSATQRGDCGGAAAVVARLCARGTRLQKDQRDTAGNTALMLAVRYNNLEITRLLLLLRPDLCSLHARNQEGRTVMDLARIHHVSPEILRLLQAKAVSVQKNLLPTRRRGKH